MAVICIPPFIEADGVLIDIWNGTVEAARPSGISANSEKNIEKEFKIMLWQVHESGRMQIERINSHER